MGRLLVVVVVAVLSAWAVWAALAVSPMEESVVTVVVAGRACRLVGTILLTMAREQASVAKLHFTDFRRLLLHGHGLQNITLHGIMRSDAAEEALFGWWLFLRWGIFELI